jgi:hypothetical protein
MYSLAGRAKTIDALLHEWKSDLLRIWIPLIAVAIFLHVATSRASAVQRR